MESSVYFIEAAELKRIKIGVTRNITRRLAHLQLASPCKLTLLGTVPGGYREKRAMHHTFRVYHLFGEWYDATNVCKAMIKSLLYDECNSYSVTQAINILQQKYQPQASNVQSAYNDYILATKQRLK